MSGNYAITFIGQNAYNGNDYTIDGYGIYEIIRRTVGASISPSYDSNVYDGSQKGYTANVDGGAGDEVIEYELRYSGRNGTVYPAAGEYTTAAPTNAGDYTVTLAFTDPEQGGNYQFGGDFSIDYSIAKATYGWASSVRFNDAYSPTFRNEAFVIELIGADLIRAGADGVAVTVNYYTEDGLVLTVEYGADGEISRSEGEFAGITHVSESGTWRAEFVIESTNYNTPSGGRLSTTITVTPRVLGQTYEDGAATVSIVWSSQERFTYNGENQQGSVYAEYTPLGAGKPVQLVLETVDFTDYLATGYTFTVADFGESDAAAGDYALPALETSRQKPYYIDRRAVTIAAADGTGTYGNAPAGLTWKYTGDSDGDASLQFVESDNIDFTVLTDAGSTSNVGDYPTRISAVASGSDRLFNYMVNTIDGSILASGDIEAFFANARGTFTVEKRDLEVTVTASGVTYTGAPYSEHDPSPLSVTSDAVNNDALEWVYTYLKEGEDGFASMGAGVVPADAGTYYVVVTFAEADPLFASNKNGNYSFGSARSDEFIISVAQITIEQKEGFTVKYDGQPHYFRTDGVHQGEAKLFARTWGEGNTPQWLFSIVPGEEGKGDFSEGNTIVSLTDVKDWNGSKEGVYTVYFMVTATNHEPAYGTFKVTIERAPNSWKQEYSHAGWEYKGDDLGVDYPFLIPSREARAAFGDVKYTYYTDEDCLDQIESPETFFNKATPAGTYYVKASVPDTEDNYAGIEGVYTIVVTKHLLDITWQYPSIALNDEEKTENLIRGYNPLLMRLNDATPGLDFDEARGAAAKPGEIGDYYVNIELVDPANYAWARRSPTRICAGSPSPSIPT